MITIIMKRKCTFLRFYTDLQTKNDKDFDEEEIWVYILSWIVALQYMYSYGVNKHGPNRNIPHRPKPINAIITKI